MAEHMKIAAIVIAVGLLAGACSDGGRPEPASTTTPPPPTLTPVATPTLLPALEPTSNIDTSDWETYASPLGVTISYPPDWTFVGSFNEAAEHDPEGTYALFNNGVFDDTREAGGTPRVMRATIRLYPGEFDRELFLGICPGLPALISIDGRETVICEIEAVTPAGLDSVSFWLEMDMPSGDVVNVSSSAIGPTGNDVAIVRGIIESVTLTSPIDTSEWRSYVSPLGFELQYPPDWTLDIVSDSQMRILDPAYKKALDDAIAAGHEDVGLPPLPGASQFSVIADISPGFDVDQLIGSCGNDALRATFLGRDAIHCPGTGTLTDTLRSAGHSYWVEFPPGHTMLIGGSVISEDAPDLAVVEAILSTFRFTPSP